MQHVAIMKKSWGLLPKILSGEKTIESRWYINRSAPWGAISPGDIVYFKNSGEPVTVRAKVAKVLGFANLTPKKVGDILSQYAKADGIGKAEIPTYAKLFRDKKYCLLIFLKDPKPVAPFNINKTGFGSMSAWLSVPNIQKIKV